MKQATKSKEGSPKDDQKSTRMNKLGELKTDFPLSEKDEIKQAEERMRKAAKARR